MDPENKLPHHNFVESLQNPLINRDITALYNNGEAKVQIPDYFEALIIKDETMVGLFPKPYSFR